MSAWYGMGAQEVLEELETSRRGGLTAAEARRRLERYGENELERPAQESMLRRFLRQMKDPMIVVLLCAAGVSLWAGGGRDWVDAVIILGIVLLNAVLSLSQEDSAQRALEALRDL